MVTEHAYAPTLAETARAHIVAVSQAFMDATGINETFASRMMKGDPAFYRRLPETTMNIRTYDEVMGRLSAAFPEGATWPVQVPRPAPSGLTDDVRREIEARIAKAAARRKVTEAVRESARVIEDLAQKAAQAAKATADIGATSAPAEAGQAPAHR